MKNNETVMCTRCNGLGDVTVEQQVAIDAEEAEVDRLRVALKAVAIELERYRACDDRKGSCRQCTNRLIAACAAASALFCPACHGSGEHSGGACVACGGGR